MTPDTIETVKNTDTIVGSGTEATKGALVFIKYEGRLESGEIFDSTDLQGRPFQFVVGSTKVIKGLSQAVMGMREGGKRTSFIPSSLAYGERQVGQKIKPHSNLIFHIELIESRPRE